MRRAALIERLNEFVDRGWITPAERQAIIDLYDEDALPPEALPGPIEDDDRDVWLIALAGAGLAGLTLSRRRNDRRQRDRARDRLRRQFEQTIAGLADDVARNANFATWQRGMMQTIGDYARQMATIGYSGPLPGPAQANLARIIAQQEQYLARFALQIATRHAAGRPMTAAYINARGRMYGAPGWGQYFAHAEAIDADEYGIVYQYLAMDDNRTCAPCHQYSGRYFLPGEGPYPGDVCAGGGACRCERVPVYNPLLYAQLAGL